jgi:hypothetical protein
MHKEIQEDLTPLSFGEGSGVGPKYKSEVKNNKAKV